MMRLWLASSLLLVSFTASADPAPQAASVPLDAARIERHALELFMGHGIPVDQAAAAREFEIAARAGRPFAQLMLANQFFDGLGVKADLKRAFELYDAAARQGLAAAQSALGWMHLRGTGSKRNVPEALRWLTAAASQGDARALLLLSGIYGKGEGVVADPDFARRLMSRSAELGDVEACRRLGVELLYGPVAQRDSAYGLQVLRKAAGMQDGDAAYLLGWWYLSNRRSARELPEAVRWMAESAKTQHQLAALWLSEMYDKGLGVPMNPAKARQLRQQALAKASLREKNDFAWELSVSDDGLLRNGQLAVRIMRAALTTPQARTAPYLDTLAAAHAEAGDFEQAIAAQQDALQTLASSSLEHQLRPQMSQRLQSYRDGQAFREPRQ